MSRLFRWLVDRLSHMLKPGEREAVLGDLAESGATGSRALRELSGLIARREWRLWLALVLLAGQSFALLIFVSAPILNFDIWWKYGVRYEDGLSPARDAVVLACYCFALIFCCWTSGFALASFSRRQIQLKAALFHVVLLFCLAGFMASSRVAVHNAVFLLVAVTALVSLPSIAGVYRGSGIARLSTRGALLVAAGMLTISVLAIWTSTWQRAALESWSGGEIQTRFIWQWQALLPFALLNWPAAYLAASERLARLSDGF